MRPRARPLSLGLLLATLLPLAPALAQIGFDDLGVAGGPRPGPAPEVVQGDAAAAPGTDWRTADHPTMPGWAALRERLLRSEAALDRALVAFEEFMKTTEAQGTSRSGRYLFQDLGRYRRAEARALELSGDLGAAAQELAEVARALPELERRGEPMWALEGRVAWTRQVTLYDQLLEWSRARRLTYQGARSRDRIEMPMLLVQATLEAIPLPRTPGVRAGSLLTHPRTEALVEGLTREGEAAVREAEQARQILEREAKRSFRGFTGWVTMRYSTASLFDVLIKPQATRLAVASLRAKAALNAAVLAAEAPNQGPLSEVNRTAVRSLARRWAAVACWGESRFLDIEESRPERSLYVYDGDDFADRHRIRTRGPEAGYLEDTVGILRRREEHREVERP